MNRVIYDRLTQEAFPIKVSLLTSWRRYGCLLTLLGLLLVKQAVAQTPAKAPVTSPDIPAQMPTRPLRVATRVIAPFVVEENNKFSGFSIELWDSICEELKIESQLTPYPTVKDLLAAVKTGKAEIGIAAISITSERDREFDFSQPIYDSGLQILVRSQSANGGSMPSILSIIFSPFMLQFLVVVLLISLIPAHLIWWLERRHEDGIIENKDYFPGIFKAIWWSAGTLGAQADEMPKTTAGRFIAILWMFMGIACIAYFTAAVTSAMTVQQLQGDIRGPNDLLGKTVATTKGSTSARYLQERHIQTLEFPQIDQAYQALLDRKADAVVFDAPVLLYYSAHEGSGKVQVVGEMFRKEDYGIVFPPRSPYRKLINNALLALKENGTYDQLHDKWFKTETDGQS